MAMRTSPPSWATLRCNKVRSRAAGLLTASSMALLVIANRVIGAP